MTSDWTLYDEEDGHDTCLRTALHSKVPRELSSNEKRARSSRYRRRRTAAGGMHRRSRKRHFV